MDIEKKILEKIGKNQGYKNPEDIYDADYDTIEKDISDASPKIILRVDQESSFEQQALFYEIRSFVTDISNDFKEKFISLLKQYRSERRSISDTIVTYVKDHGFFMPQFTIADSKQGKKILGDLGYSDENISKKNMLVICNLPKPLSYYWWKGGDNSWGDLGKEVGPSVIEWGYFYRQLMPVIWSHVGKQEMENGLSIERINPTNRHDPKSYYYIWEIGY